MSSMKNNLQTFPYLKDEENYVEVLKRLIKWKTNFEEELKEDLKKIMIKSLYNRLKRFHEINRIKMILGDED